MKMIKQSIIGAVALSFASAVQTHAITNTAIAVSGTNLVLSWPSYGYESYLVQYRQTLNSTDSWSIVTNAYPANSTNRTTFTLYGLVPPSASGGGSGSGNLVGGPPSPSFASRSIMASAAGPLAMPADGSGGAVPLALYPPGFDLSGFTILDPLSGESVSGSSYSVSSLSLDSPQPLDNTPSDLLAPQTGFYRVFHIPNFPAGITNYTFDGPTFIPVDYAAPDAPPDSVDNTTVLIGGQPIDYAQFMPYVINGVTNWGVGVFFDRLPNGTNTIQLLTTVRQSDTLNDQTPYMVFSNAPAVITIGNLITFTNCDDLIWNNTNYTFRAQTVPNVDWEIDIYDWNGNFVNYQTGHSSDGNISWTWNLYDYWDNPRTNPDSDPAFYPYYTITGNLPGSAQNAGYEANANNSSATRPGSAAAAPFPSVGGWIVAYMTNYYTDGRTNFDGSGYNAAYSSGINAIAGTAVEWRIPVIKFPIAFGRSYTQTNRNTSWSNLASWLYYSQYRNFYYFGHGSADIIGCDINTVDSSNNITGGDSLPNSKACLSSKTISDNIAFNPSGARPYRFVFLDGCNTANGGFAPAFGIPKQAVTGGWYFSNDNARHIRPSAFMGWNTETGTGINRGWGTVQGFWSFRSIWITQWADTMGELLDDAIVVARDTSGWVAPSQVTDHLVYCGDRELLYFQYNYGGDWP